MRRVVWSVTTKSIGRGGVTTLKLDALESLGFRKYTLTLWHGLCPTIWYTSRP